MLTQNPIEVDVAILGGGFAGVYCAKTLGKGRVTLNGRRLRVALVSEENYMVFQPMLPEVAGSSISPRHVVNPLRLLCRQAQVFRGHVESINWSERRLELNGGPFSGNVCIHCEQLVLALGAVTDLSRIPGMPEHAFLIKNVGDAMLLRSTLVGRIEEASLERRPDVRRRLLTFVVVGGGYSGVETAGHMLDLFGSIHPYFSNLPPEEFQVYLIHSGDHLLPTLSQRLGDYSARKLCERGLKLILNQRVRSITAQRVYLDNETIIETNTVISTVGNATHPLVTDLARQCGVELSKGSLPTEPTGRVVQHTHLWAIGDCAAFPYVNGGVCPSTAQFAMRQGILVGKNLVHHWRGQPFENFTYKGVGELASIGHHEAVAEIFGVQFSGFIAWWLWRTVYLLKLPRLDRKVRVMLDWTLDLFFPRDLNHLSPRFSKPLKEIYLETGDVLFRDGEPAFSFYIVKSGTIELRRATEAPRRIERGGYFGEQALLSDCLWHDDAIAVEPTRLVSIPAGVFHQLADGPGSLGRFFQKSATKYQSRDIVEAISRKIPSDVAAQPIDRLMERRLYTMTPDMTVQQAMALTRKHPRSSYPVMDASRRLLGTVTREDFYEFVKSRETTAETRIDQMKYAQVPTVLVDTSIEEVMRCFIRSGSNKVLVVDGDAHLHGIATVMDLMAAGAEASDGLGK